MSMSATSFSFYKGILNMKKNSFSIVAAVFTLALAGGVATSTGCGGISTSSLCEDICACERCTSNDLQTCKDKGSAAAWRGTAGSAFVTAAWACSARCCCTRRCSACTADIAARRYTACGCGLLGNSRRTFSSTECAARSNYRRGRIVVIVVAFIRIVALRNVPIVKIIIVIVVEITVVISSATGCSALRFIALATRFVFDARHFTLIALFIARASRDVGIFTLDTP